MIRTSDNTVYCNCNRYEQFGLLCSHIFFVLRLGDVREFPKQYVLPRWTRDVVPNSEPGDIIRADVESDNNDDVKRVVREITYGMESVINKIVNDFNVLCTFRDHINQFMPTAVEAQINAPRKSRRDRFAELTGNAKESSITVRVPIGTRFKGMGKPKRMKSKREIAISQSGKKRRQCANCLQYGHNIRTCTNAKVVVEKVVVENDVTSEENESLEVAADAVSSAESESV